MTQENFIKRYDALNICDRADLHEIWTNELYKLAKVCDNAEIIDQHTKPGNCCPCIIFEADGFRAVAYLHSDCFRPAMWFGGADGYTSIDYRDMLAVLYGNFANVTAPDYLDELPAPAIEDDNTTEDETTENSATEQTNTPARILFTADDCPDIDTTTNPRAIIREVVSTAAVVLLTLTIGTSKQPAQIYTDTPAAVLAQIEQAGETVTAYKIE